MRLPRVSLIAFPESKRILNIHLLATPFMSVQLAVMLMIPVLLRKGFGASPWQTVVATSAIAIMSLLSVLWNELYRRWPPGVYLVVFWLAAAVPLG